jgi:hypothetical protein
MNSDVKTKGPEQAEIPHVKVLITLGLLTETGHHHISHRQKTLNALFIALLSFLL